jgi:Holliday junction resolvasome RuvABC ATP-dependent DNA helicase subunit
VSYKAQLPITQKLATSKGKMPNISKMIADQIRSSTVSLKYKKWFDEEVNDLALKFSGLDEFSSQAVLPLIHIAANGKTSLERLAIAFDMEEDTLNGYMQSLCEFNFAQEAGDGFTATPLGEQVFKAIGQKMVIRERFELTTRLVKLDSLYKQLPDF